MVLLFFIVPSNNKPQYSHNIFLFLEYFKVLFIFILLIYYWYNIDTINDLWLRYYWSTIEIVDILLISCESKVACKFSVFYSNSRFLKFDWWFQKLVVSDPTPTGLALQFEYLKSQKRLIFDQNVIFVARKSSRRGLLGKIFDKLWIQGRMQIFEKMSRLL